MNKRPNPKVSREMFIAIRKDALLGVSRETLSRRYKISRDTLRRVVHASGWNEWTAKLEQKRLRYHEKKKQAAPEQIVMQDPDAPEQVTMEDAVVAASPEIPANLPYDVCRWIKYLNQDDELAQVIGTLIRRDPEHFVDHVRLLWMTWRPKE